MSEKKLVQQNCIFLFVFGGRILFVTISGGERVTKTQKLFSIGICVLFITALYFETDLLFINTMGSLPKGIYLRIPTFGNRYRCGDIVVYEPPQDVISFAFERGYVTDVNHVSFMKHIGALAGDCYAVTIKEPYVFAVNGKYVSMVQTKDSLGRELPIMHGLHTVGKDEFLPVSVYAENSFDGRYTGTVSKDNIQARVIPFIVEW